MASSSHPTRSVSFPSRSLFNTLKMEDILNKLKSRDFSSASTSGCLGAESIQFGLLGLVELFADVQQLILSPSTQQTLLRQDQGKLVEEALESSVGLIDTCSTVRDLIVRLKEQVRDLQSALRRKGYLSVESEINVYMSLRKKLAKDVVRCLKVVKQSEGKYGLAAPLPNLDPSLPLLVSLIKEVYAVTMSVFKSLFLFLSVPAKATKWSLISRLVAKRPIVVSSKSEEIRNEVAGVDVALDCIDGTKAGVLLVQGRIQALDASIQILEGELECLFRCLVQNRVSLLNILTQ